MRNFRGFIEVFLSVTVILFLSGLALTQAPNRMVQESNQDRYREHGCSEDRSASSYQNSKCTNITKTSTYFVSQAAQILRNRFCIFSLVKIKHCYSTQAQAKLMLHE